MQTERTKDQGSRSIGQVLWKVEFRCAQEGCAIPIVLHIVTDEGIAKDAITAMAANAIPTPTCGNGHTLPANPLIHGLKVVD
jgi:hypothetical protein